LIINHPHSAGAWVVFSKAGIAMHGGTNFGQKTRVTKLIVK
jgi:hypothetical protein